MTPRPFWHWLLIALAVWLINLFVMLNRAVVALPVSLTIPSLGEHSALLLSTRNIGLTNSCTEIPLDNRTWLIQGVWIRDFQLRASAMGIRRVQSLDIGIDRQTFRLPVDQLTGELSAKGISLSDNNPLVFDLPSTLSAPRSRLFWLNDIRNWPGDAFFLRQSLRPTGLGLGLIILVVILLRVAMWSTRFSLWIHLGLATGSKMPPPRSDISGDVSRFWLMTGLAILLGCLCLLESMQPCYFAQGDNFCTYFPVQIQACRSLEAGIFPTWNPCQSLGVPTTSTGVCALTYPGTFLSYVISRHLLGDEYLMMEVFAMLHLVLGYLSTFCVARSFGMRPTLALSSSLAFTLSGFFLIVGRSWYYMLPVALWFPLLMLSAAKLRHGPASWKWVVGTGIVIGMFYHAGNVQMWTYGILFFLLAVVAWGSTGAIPFRRSLQILPALLLGIGLAAPVLLVQWKVMSTLDRPGGGGEPLYLQNLWSMLVPYPLSHHHPPWPPGTSYVHLTDQIYYSGTVLVAAGFLTVVTILLLTIAFCWNRSLVKQVMANNVWLICMIIGIWASLGNHAFLWTWMSKLPGFTRFTAPLKFLPFINFFCLIGGGLVCERFIARSNHAGRWERLLLILVTGLMVYHTSLSRLSFYTFSDRPYPGLPKELTSLIAPGTNAFPQRVLSVSPMRSTGLRYVDSLNLNFPTIYDILSITGYNLIECSPHFQLVTDRMASNPAATLRAYGVRWVLAHRLAFQPVFSENPANRDSETLTGSDIALWEQLKPELQMKLALDNVTVFELPRTAPLAFATGSPDQALPVLFYTRGATVRVPQSTHIGQVTINVLWWPDMVGKADGKIIPCQADDWGRVILEVPAGADIVEVCYAPSWKAGIIVGFVFIGLAILLMFSASKWEHPA